MRETDSEHPIREAILSFESLLLCHVAFLRRVPFLRLLHRAVTADLRILSPQDRVAAELRVDFRSPYFHVPVNVDKSQIGRTKTGQWLEPGAFRLFDWQTWEHIDGKVEWHGEQRTLSEGRQLDLITGFCYRIPELPEGAGNLGLRLAEGVDGELSIACGGASARVGFEPVFWLLEATNDGFRPVPIRTNKLMGLIVSLFDIAGGNSLVAEDAVTRLRQWAEHNLGSKKPFTGTRKLLEYIRDWGPLGMEPLYKGIKELFDQLQVADLERALFDFVADNWGVRSNRNGRVLAVKLLGTLDTDAAEAALQAVYELVRYGGIDGDELGLMRSLAEKRKWPKY
jgi:hypothetical protein